MQNIGEIIKAENSAVTPMFRESTYNAGTGKPYKQYLINRDGFSLLAMGFTGKKALEWKIKFIKAFNSMEAKLKEQAATLVDDDRTPKTYLDSLKQLVAAVE